VKIIEGLRIIMGTRRTLLINIFFLNHGLEVHLQFAKRGLELPPNKMPSTVSILIRRPETFCQPICIILHKTACILCHWNVQNVCPACHTRDAAASCHSHGTKTFSAAEAARVLYTANSGFRNVTLRWDMHVVCHKYHKNEEESQSEHN